MESLADTNTNIVAPQPQTQASAAFLNQTDAPHDGGHHRRGLSNGSGEVMKATMTDVQQALEQLGRGPNGDRDDRSFSFASSRGENTETEDDYDMSDLDGAVPNTGEDWYKRARTRLAAKAKKAVEEAEKLEAMMGGPVARRLTLPIQVELSDESEGEDGDYTTHTSPLPRRHPYILEEDEESEITRQVVSKRSSEHERDTVKEDSSNEITVTEDTPADPGTATGPRFSLPSDVDASPNPPSAANSYSLATPVSPVTGPVVTFQEPKHEHTLNPRSANIALPSPTSSFPAPKPGPHPDRSKYMSVMSIYSDPSNASETSPRLPSSTDNTFVGDKDTEKQDKVHPSEWTVEDVVDWLKSKGFDQDVCDKFTGQPHQLPEFCFSDNFFLGVIEQEITGDVLLDLDVNLLKTEIGIVAFGKRMRIANAITDLRRPPSIVYSDHQPGQPLSPTHITHPHAHQHVSLTPSQSVSQIQSHSRNVSQSHSNNSFPGAPYIPQRRSSLGNNTPPFGYVVSGGHGNGYGYGMMTPSESPATEYMGSEALMPENERIRSMGMGLPSRFLNENGSVSRYLPLIERFYIVGRAGRVNWRFRQVTVH